MSTELLKSCLSVMEQQGETSLDFHNYFMRIKSLLLESDETAVGLIMLFGHLDEDSENVEELLRLLLDEARMGLENDYAYASRFLETVEIAIDAGIESGELKQQDLMTFAKLYRRAGLPVPQSLVIDPDMVAPPKEGQDIDPSEMLEGLARDVQTEGGGPFELFSGLSEMTAALSDEFQANFANQVSIVPSPIFERCALYFVLSGSPLVQEATISGLFERLEGPGLNADTLVFLPIIRSWMPSGHIQTGLDELIKRARRKNHSISSNDPRSVQILEITASVADGVGAQNLAISIEMDGAFSVCVALTKDGYGIKDAFVVPCDTRLEADSIVMNVRHASHATDIKLSTLMVLLEAALADGVDHTAIPAPGFLDVMESCGFLDLRPQALTLQELLEFADPEGRIGDASPQALGRWSKNEAALASLEDMTASWFEDNQETRKIVAAGRSSRSIEIKIWKYLEGRRELWARRFLQTAVILKDADRPREWKTLTASACGLMTGRPLKRIPLIENIVWITIEAADGWGR
jgi:hypothetical protein